MLYHLAEYLREYLSALNALSYLTTRAILGVLSALLISFLVGPLMIRRLSHYQMGQQVRDDGPSSHLSKAGTPTMGGALIILTVALATLLWADLTNKFVWLIVVVTVLFGLVGWVDDWLKIRRGNCKGLSARQKYFWQSVIALTAAVILYVTASGAAETQLLIPFFKNFYVDLGWFYIPFVYLVVVGSSNAVNLTDGLDGLAIMPTVLVAGALGVFAYAIGNFKFAEYLNFPFIPGVGELVVFAGALVGAGLGFLWFNAYPAQVFMGDVGALALGAALGLLAVMARQEIVLMIMGGVFVMETVSVILQVGSYKLTGQRIFRMAPLHHHFELKGWPEPRVIVRFWIITVILVLVGLSTLKLR